MSAAIRTLDSATYDRAEGARKRRDAPTGLSFTSIPRALTWFYEARVKLSSPKGMLTNLTRVSGSDGLTVRFQAPLGGGKGGDLDETFSTLCAIDKALSELTADNPRAARAVRLRHCDGRSIEKLADELGCASNTASALLGAGEGFLSGYLRAEGVLA